MERATIKENAKEYLIKAIAQELAINTLKIKEYVIWI